MIRAERSKQSIPDFIEAIFQAHGSLDDFARCQAEHADRFAIEVIAGLENLTYLTARSAERGVIEYDLAVQEGGQLVNKINSIATKNPCYRQAVDLGRAMLDAIGLQR